MTLLLGLALGVAFGAVVALAIRRRELAGLRERERELRRERATLVAQVLGAEERERARVAQVLHDDALQSLLAAHQDLIEAAPGRAQVTRAHEIMGVAIDRVRDAVTALHPVILERQGLEAALEAVCADAEHQGGFETSLHVEADALGSTDGLVLSIARELLTNAARHAGARQVEVMVSAGSGEVVLSVADDGSGIDPERPDEALAEGHVGLASIAQRLEGIGGSLDLESQDGVGTRAVAHLPV